MTLGRRTFRVTSLIDDRKAVSDAEKARFAGVYGLRTRESDAVHGRKQLAIEAGDLLQVAEPASVYRD